MRVMWKTAVRLVAPIVFLCACVSPASSGAWLEKAGHWQVIMSGTFTDSPKAFDASGRVRDAADYRKFEFSPYFEFGLTDNLTIIAQPRLRHVSIDGPVDASHTGAGHSDLGARLRLWSGGNAILSGQVTASIAGGGDSDDPALAGDTEHELDVRALYGHSFTLGPWASFLDAELAYRLRGGALQDQVRLDLTLGTRPRPDILLLAQSFNTFSTGRSQSIYDVGREHKLQVSAVWDATEHLSLQLGAIATVAGESSLRERGVVTALWWRF